MKNVTAQLRIAKDIMRKYIEEKIISEQTTMLTGFERWFNYVQYVSSEEKKMDGVVEYHTKLTLYKSFKAWSKTTSTMIKAKQVS